MSDKMDNAQTTTSGHMFNLGTMPESEDTEAFTQNLMKNLNQENLTFELKMITLLQLLQKFLQSKIRKIFSQEMTAKTK